MLNSRQQEIIELLKANQTLKTKQLLQSLKLTRARINQLVLPLIRRGLIKREGYARATVYMLTGKRSYDQITRENWGLKQRIIELEKALEERKIIEQAKEILIAQFDIPPTEAYRKLQQKSMNTGKSVAKIAEAILSAYRI